MTTPWEIIDSMNSHNSNFSIITMNQSDASQVTVISKKSTKGKVLANFCLVKFNIYFQIFSINSSSITINTYFETINTKAINKRCEIYESMCT